MEDFAASTRRANYRFTTYQDARRVRLVDGLIFKTNILRVSPVNVQTIIFSQSNDLEGLTLTAGDTCKIFVSNILLLIDDVNPSRSLMRSKNDSSRGASKRRSPPNFALTIALSLAVARDRRRK